MRARLTLLALIAVAAAAHGQEARPPVRVVEGRVVDGAGAAVPGARVTVWARASHGDAGDERSRRFARIPPALRADAVSWLEADVSAIATALTGPGGEFRLDRVPKEGLSRLTAEAVDPAGRRLAGFDYLFDFRPEPCVVHLAPAVWLDARVHAGEAAVGGAAVTVRQGFTEPYRCSVSRFGDWTWTTNWELQPSPREPRDAFEGHHVASVIETDRTGRASMELDPSHRTRVSVAIPGHATVHARFPGGMVEADLALEPESRVSGRVVDAGGRPVHAAWVRAFDACPGDLALTTESLTDEGGRFSLLRLGRGRYRLHVKPQTGLVPRTLDVVSPREDLEVRLEPEARLDLAVSVAADAATIASMVDAAGKGTALVVGGDGTSASGRGWTGRVNASLLIERQQGDAWEAEAAATFRFDLTYSHALPRAPFAALPAGRYRARLIATAFQTVTSEVLELKAGDAKSARLELRFPLRTIAGRVVDGRRVGLPGASVSFTDRDVLRSLVTGEGGEFRLDDVPGEATTIEVSHPQHGKRTIVIPAGVATIPEILLERN